MCAYLFISLICLLSFLFQSLCPSLVSCFLHSNMIYLALKFPMFCLYEMLFVSALFPNVIFAEQKIYG